ncbi:unnamed protein product [Diamesa tonsa]
MKLLLLLVVLTVSCNGMKLEGVQMFQRNLTIPVNGKIWNGQRAQPGQFPYQAWLIVQTKRGTSVCSGSLVTDRFILGCAHCIAETDATSVLVQLGNVNKNQSPVNIYANAFYWIYVNGKIPDIAMYRLFSPAPLSNNIYPVKLPRRSQQGLSTFDNARAIVSGFGGTVNGLPDLLQFTTMKVLTNQECQRYYTGNFIDSNKLCARGDPNPKSGICGGDSGGPLVIYENNEAVLIGISIVTLGGCDSGYPNGFTRVGAYLDYISHETGLQIRN